MPQTGGSSRSCKEVADATREGGHDLLYAAFSPDGRRVIYPMFRSTQDLIDYANTVLL
jgi:hypothetical protein